MVKNPPAYAGDAGDVGFITELGISPGEMEKEIATHSRIPAWEIPCTEEPGGPQSMGLQELDTTQ